MTVHFYTWPCTNKARNLLHTYTHKEHNLNSKDSFVYYYIVDVRGEESMSKEGGGGVILYEWNKNVEGGALEVQHIT